MKKNRWVATLKPCRVIGFAAIYLFGMTLNLRAGDPDSIRRALDRISVTDLKRHCGTLASDALEGRQAGSQGGQAAAAYLQSELQKATGISPANSNGWVQEFGGSYRNIIGVLPGSDSALSHELIVIGAHYDHVGRGQAGNSKGQIGSIHNGADDNASGTAALLELVDAFVSLRPAPRRTLLFAFWDAEEIGLLGSRHWVGHPTHPLKNVRLAVNIDMVGRLRTGQLAITGWRSAAGLRSRLVQHNPEGDLEYTYNPRVISDSDHHSFYVAGIPCLQLDTGMHDDYHRPSDDADKLDYAGLRRITELLFRFVLDAADDANVPRFRREALTEAPPAWLSPGAKVVNARLGVSFDREEFAANRAVVSEVVANSAAFRAGIHPGDQLVSVAHWHGASVADLRTIVQVARNPVSIRILRNGSPDPTDLKVELSGDPVRVGIAWQRDDAIADGIVISRVVAESPADRAGLKAGDVLLRMTGGPIGTDDAFQRRLLNDPGPLRFHVERSGRTTEVIVPLYEAPTRP